LTGGMLVCEVLTIGLYNGQWKPSSKTALLPVGERGPSVLRVATDYDVGSGVGVGGSSRKSSRVLSTKSFTVYSDTRT
jgi:hypothetical protein